MKEPFEETLGMAHLVQMLNTEVERHSRDEQADDEDGPAAKQDVSGFVARGTTQFGLVSIICNLTSTELTKDEQIRRKLLEQGQEATVEQVEKLRKLSECKDPNDEAFQEPPEKLTDPKIIDRMRCTVVAENGVAAILSVMRNNPDVSDNTQEMIAKMQDEVVVLHSRLTTETARFKAAISHQQQHAQVDFGADTEAIRRRYRADIEPKWSRYGADMEPK